MLSFGALASQAGRSELARSVLERCVEFPELDDPRRAATLDALAATAIDEGRLDKAHEYLDAALAARRPGAAHRAADPLAAGAPRPGGRAIRPRGSAPGGC